MATKTQSTRRNGKNSSGGESAFSWGGGKSAGVLLGAAAAGAAFGFAANIGRKLFVQMGSGASGDWFDALRAEHQATLALFDTIEATRDDQATTRSHLLAKLKYALTKHAHEEESIIYPALRQANLAHDADVLNAEHGYVKTYLYELENMAKDDPSWLDRVRDFRAMLEEHIRMEEIEAFPAFRNQLTDEQNAKLTAAMNKEGFKMA
jgi:hemerythrin superfamily protein